MPQLQSQPGRGVPQRSPASFKHRLAPGRSSLVRLFYLKTGARGRRNISAGKGRFSSPRFHAPPVSTCRGLRGEGITGQEDRRALLSLLLRLSTYSPHMRGEASHRRKAEVKTRSVSAVYRRAVEEATVQLQADRRRGEGSARAGDPGAGCGAGPGPRVSLEGQSAAGGAGALGPPDEASPKETRCALGERFC